MISKHKITFKDGTVKTQIRVVEGYRPYPGASPKQRQIKNFGYLEDWDDKDELWRQVNECNDELKSNKERITVSLNTLGSLDDCKIYNYGYRYLEAVYDFLELDRFFRRMNFKSDYDVNEVFKFLVIERILNPDSKRATAQLIGTLYNKDDLFTLMNIYRSLDKIEECMDDMQIHLNDIIKKKVGRDESYAFYDTTNYYFEKDFPTSEDSLGQKGVSKEHKTEPIVQLGLFMDSKKLPMRMELYKGNTSDSLTLKPSIELIKNHFELQRLIVVADKGMNSQSNLAYIHDKGDGYVVSQILRGKKGKRYHEKMFEDEKFICNEDGSYKYRIFEEKISVKNSEGKKEELTQNVLIYWRKANEQRERKAREVKVRKAIRSMTNNAYSLTHDATQYLKELHIEGSTGIVADKKQLMLDLEKIAEDERYDGYACIITSELDYDSVKIHEVYSDLEKIEESFRITKSDLETRPIYVQTDKHIKAHFQICFVALLIIRLIQLKMGEDQISTERMQRALNSCGCEEIVPGIIHLMMVEGRKSYLKIMDESEKEKYKLELTNESETLEDYKKIQKAFNSELKYINMKREVFNKQLKKIKFTITK